MRQLVLIALALSATVLVCSGCGDDEKGACVWNGSTGYDFRCWDDYTSGQCTSMNGTLYVGETCSGLQKSNPSGSVLALSEICLDMTNARWNWIELFNGAPSPIDLQGATLTVVGGAGEERIDLDGVISGCSTYVVGRSEAGSLFGAPVLDQEIRDHREKILGRPAELRLQAPDGGVLDRVEIGIPGGEGSLERTGWPGGEWAVAPLPDPNHVPDRFVCLPHPTREWRTITGVYR